MSYSGGKIEPPVNQDDVQRALGIAVDGDWQAMCTSNNINMWARYKPIRAALIPVINYQTRKNVLFGLEVPWCDRYRITQGGQTYIETMNGKVYAILYNVGENNGWNYLKPRGDRTPQGGIQEFFRITDFVRNPNDDTDPYYGTPYAKGYNHNAHEPFTAFIDSPGVTEKSPDDDGIWYEINIQVTNTLKLTFFNSVGDDLHLQDFIDLNRTGDVVWRPVLQLFKGFDATAWYDKQTPDAEFAGGAITSDQTATWSVSLPLVGLVTNQFYHLCVGIGCVNPTFTQWADTNALFIAPYTTQMLDDDKLPFYVRFKVVDYADRRLSVLGLQFNRYGTSWVDAGGTAPYFTITKAQMYGDMIGLTLTITRSAQAVDFIGENGTPSAGYSPLKIQAREMIAGVGGETIRYLSPSTGPSNWGSAQYIHVPAGSESQITTLYATLYIGNIAANGYGEYHLYSTTNGTTFVNIGSFSIHMI